MKSVSSFSSIDTRRKQENKDLFKDIDVVLIIYQLILVLKPFYS